MRVWLGFGQFVEHLSAITRYPLCWMSAIERFGCVEILRKEKATLDAELEIKTKSVTDPSGNREFVLDNLKVVCVEGTDLC